MLALPLVGTRGLQLGRLQEKNDLFVALKGLFYCPSAFNRQRLMRPCNKKPPPVSLRWSFFSCRGEKTRTSGPYVPNVVRYQLRYTPFYPRNTPTGVEGGLPEQIQVRKNNKIFILKELFDYIRVSSAILRCKSLLLTGLGR